MTPRERATRVVEECQATTPNGYPAVIISAVECAIIAAVKAEREACAQIAKEKLDSSNAMIRQTPQIGGLAYSSATAADIRDAIERRPRL